MRAVLRRYHAVTVVPSRLSTALQVPADKIDALIDITGRPLVGPGMALALRAVVPPEGPLPSEAQPLVDLVNALVPLTVLFTHPAFDADAIRFVQKQGSAFGLDNLPAVNIAGVRALSVYSRFAPVASDVQFTGDSPPIDAADLKRALSHFDPASGFADAVNDDLARMFRTGKRTMALLRKHVALAKPAAAALEQLARCADLSSRLGVGGPALADAVAVPGPGDDTHERAASEYEQLAQAATAIRAALRARYPDEADLQAQLDPIEDSLRSRKRDALTDYLLHSYRPAFADRRAIYEYFLIDVELEGCARTRGWSRRPTACSSTSSVA